MKSRQLLLAFATLVFCVNMGDNTSINSEKAPSTVCNGILTDAQGNETKVTDITISGIFEKIPFYKKPADTTVNPSNNDVTQIDLMKNGVVKVQEIKLKDGTPKKYGGREF